jgi:hypothetical protein
MLRAEEPGLIWGDVPSDIFDAAIADAVRVFMAENAGREPAEEELIADFQSALWGLDSGEGNTPSAILNVAITDAAQIFAEDVGREPTEEELTVGFQLALKDWLYGEAETPAVVSS